MEKKNGFENFEELVQKVLNRELGIGLLRNQNINLGKNSFTFDLADAVKEYFVEIKNQFNSANRGQLRDQVNGRFRLLPQSR